MVAHPGDAQRAIELAAILLQSAVDLQTPQERRQQAELDRMIHHGEDKATLIEMTDQAFRTHSPARVADQLTHVLDVQGVPRFFNPVEQAMLRGFQSFGEYLPGVAVPLVKEKMRRETANVILPAEPELLTQHLHARQSQGVQMNVNLLGEAVLGESETRRRIQQYIELLRLPQVRCVSVKISTLYSQVSSIARQQTISKVSDRLETLCRTADRQIDPDTARGKFIYLDMEEYRDLYLTADILRETLDRPGLEQTRAGIALQAYIPDSYLVMQQLIQWSADRVRRGHSPLTIRLVKGANMEMERVEASIGGHRQAPYKTKLQTDANYKRMLRDLIDAAAESHIRIGLASHNLFDVAQAMIWAESLPDPQLLQFEMLEGMANHQRRAISQRVQQMLLYAPACHQEGFLNAIGYLIRRLDENTGPQNFLRHSFRLKPDSPEFEQLAEDFRKSLEMITAISSVPRRHVDRHQEPDQPPAAAHWSRYVNEPDTDWAVPANSQWIQSVLQQWQTRCDDQAPRVPLRVGDRLVADDPDRQRQSLDPSRPGVVVCRYQLADQPQVRLAVQIAQQDVHQWRRSSAAFRHQMLREVAQRLRLQRGNLIGAMVGEGGKTVAEADPEVSEAIDFCEFYPLTAMHWCDQRTVTAAPRGVVAVITPWNFPLAIPCGGIAAALAAGNCVILKPASETVLVASMLCEAFWDAGVPREVLQLLPCQEDVAQAGLIANPAVDTVVLTGGTQTARRILSVRPDLHLLAETGGKNATIVTAMADRDQAIKHVVQSAFGHSGQKCSATSLLLLENEVFHDEHFKSALADAVESLPVGSAWDLQTKIGPLITPPTGALARGIKTLEDDESWLVVPEHVVGNPNLYRPGVKWNIRPGGFTHQTELFGPVLGVMPYNRLEEAIAIVRATGYGLTSGLESLDDREIQLWRQTIHAGNLYINRATTGAIVLRQPFGGVGLSAYGPGVKAGGPHYVLALMRVSDANADSASPAARPTQSHRELDALQQWINEADQLDADRRSEFTAMIAESAIAMETEFSRWHDTVQLVGQDNWRRYRPVRAVTIRIDDENTVRDAVCSLIAAVAVRTQVMLSLDRQLDPVLYELFESTADAVPGLIHPLEETAGELAGRIGRGDVTRLRLLRRATADNAAVLAAAELFVTVIDEPVLCDARIECLRYLDEQSISHDYHRYGNLGRRADEVRREVL